MNKKILLLALTMLLSWPLMSKGQQMDWSNVRKLKGGALFTRVIGQNSTGLYLLRFRNRFMTKSIIIDRYRNELGLAISKSIPLKKSRLLHASLHNNGLLILSAYTDRRNQINHVIAQWYDANINPVGKPLELFNVPMKDFNDKGDFRVRFNVNKDEFIVVHTSDSLGNRALHSNHFDLGLNNKRSHCQVLPVAYEDFYLPNILLTSTGNIYYYVLEKVSNPRRTEGTPKSFIFCQNQVSDTLTFVQLLDSNVRLGNVHLTHNRMTNKIQLSGFFSFMSHTRIEGLYQISFDDGQPAYAIEHYKTFEEEFRKQLFGEQERLVFNNIFNFELLEVIPNSDGGMSWIAERSSISNETDITYVNGMPTAISRNVYNFDDVMVLSTDSSMQIRWKYLINKSQSSLNDNGYYSSIVIANTRSHLYILYNDRLRTNGDVMQYTFDARGNVAYKILVRSDDHFISIIPSEAKQIDYNTVILPVSKDRKFALLKLDYIN